MSLHIVLTILFSYIYIALLLFDTLYLLDIKNPMLALY